MPDRPVVINKTPIRKLQNYGLFIEESLAQKVLSLANEDSSATTQES